MPAKLISSFLPLFANNFDCNEIDKGPQVMNCLFRFLSISAVFTWVAGQSDNVSAWGVEDELALNRAVNIENIVLVNSSSDFYEAWKGAEGQDIVLLLQSKLTRKKLEVSYHCFSSSLSTPTIKQNVRPWRDRVATVNLHKTACS